MPTDTFAVRLRILRYDLGRLSVEQIAARCGVKTATWSTWENGALPRDLSRVVRKIATATGYSADWLMWGGALTSPAIGYKFEDAGEPPNLTVHEGRRRGPAPRPLNFFTTARG